jgi:hypothetical protein
MNLTFRPVTELVPQFLGDKRNERMQQQQGLAQHQVLDREAVRLRRRVLELGLRHLDVPVAEVVPEKPVDRLHGRAELELPKQRSTSRVVPSRRSRMAWSSASNFAGSIRRKMASSEELSPASPLIWRKRQAFQSLLQKFLPLSIRSSWKADVLPWGAIDTMPKRRPSAPYFSIRSSGSGELPSDFDILRPCCVADDAGEVDMP